MCSQPIFEKKSRSLVWEHYNKTRDDLMINMKKKSIPKNLG